MAPKGFGTLYVVATPIGNLEDMTFRALKVLKDVSRIAAENVSHTRALCRHYDIGTKVISYNQHNERARASELMGQLKTGENVALVTDAGTPGISDPGAFLVGLALEERIRVTPIPGASAVMAALSVCGLPAETFVFMGFLPHKAGRRRKVLELLTTERKTAVFFEAPHRIKETLGDLRDLLGDRKVILAREITKVFEEIRRGPVSELMSHLGEDRPRGELTLVVAGVDQPVGTEFHIGSDLQRKIETLLKKKGMTLVEVARKVSEEEGLPYRRVYRACLALRAAMEGKGPETPSAAPGRWN
jgi:16S rRNA (cytidine1402-2'-O)-methyltransferase